MPKRNLIWTIAIVAAAVTTVLLTRPAAPPDDPDHVRFRPVVRAYRMLRGQTYRPPDDANLLRGAVRGMVEGLDEFSSYVPPERLASFRARLAGRGTTIGLLVDAAEGTVDVLGVLPGSPAQDAGIEPGARVLRIDGDDAEALSAEEVRQRLGRPPREGVSLVLVDPAGKERTCELAPRRMELDTVAGLRRTAAGRWEYFVLPDERIAYIRIKEFAPRTTERFEQSLRELLGARGIVLDLRDNPGGGLEAGYAVANLFLSEGVIFTRVDRLGRRQEFPARPEGTHSDVPIVVLVNGQTASAAEIVAGSLQLYDRAVLVGSRTRGKGLVQSMISLPNDLGQVNLTTAEFLLGVDQPVARRPGAERWGVGPHIELPLSPAEDRARRRYWLASEAAPASRRPATAPTTAPLPLHLRPAVEVDPQLACAVALFTEPGRIRELLAQAAAERAARQRKAASRPHTSPAGAPHGDE